MSTDGTVIKKYRFFFHYRKQTKRMTIHWRNRCIPVDDIICEAACESKWHKRQPHLTLQGYASTVDIQTDPKTQRVLGRIS